MTSYRYRRP